MVKLGLENKLQKIQFTALFISFIALISIVVVNLFIEYDTISVSENQDGIVSGTCVNAIDISYENYYIYVIVKNFIYYSISAILMIWYVESEKTNSSDIAVFVGALLLFLIVTNDVMRIILDKNRPFLVHPGKGSLLA